MTSPHPHAASQADLQQHDYHFTTGECLRRCGLGQRTKVAVPLWVRRLCLRLSGYVGDEGLPNGLISTAESEYVVAVQAVNSEIWIRVMVAELQGHDLPPVTVFEDNQACIKMVRNPVVSGSNRHFAMSMWWLRQQVDDGVVVLKYVPSESQLADMFTKVLPTPEFVRHHDGLLSTKPAVYRR